MVQPISRAAAKLGDSPEELLLGGPDEAQLLRKIDQLEDELEQARSEVIRLWIQVNLHRDDAILTHCTAEMAGAKCGMVVDRDVTDIPLCSIHLAKAHIDYEAWVAGRAKSRPTPSGAAAVYYFAWKDDRVKIGTTTGLRRRMKSLYVQPDELLAVEPGDSKREAERHRQFAGSRVVGTELFDRTPELEAHIAQVVDMFGDPRRFI